MRSLRSSTMDLTPASTTTTPIPTEAVLNSTGGYTEHKLSPAELQALFDRLLGEMDMDVRGNETFWGAWGTEMTWGLAGIALLVLVCTSWCLISKCKKMCVKRQGYQRKREPPTMEFPKLEDPEAPDVTDGARSKNPPIIKPEALARLEMTSPSVFIPMEVPKSSSPFLDERESQILNHLDDVTKQMAIIQRQLSGMGNAFCQPDLRSPFEDIKLA